MTFIWTINGAKEWIKFIVCSKCNKRLLLPWWRSYRQRWSVSLLCVCYRLFLHQSTFVLKAISNTNALQCLSCNCCVQLNVMLLTKAILQFMTKKNKSNATKKKTSQLEIASVFHILHSIRIADDHFLLLFMTIHMKHRECTFSS